MGYEWSQDLVHVAFGMISYEGQSLSTRKGMWCFWRTFCSTLSRKPAPSWRKKSPGLDNKDEVARQVGIGAVIYADLQNNRIKDIDFSWERALSFDGETGPYVQYTHARCCSALRKAEDLAPAEPDYAALSDDYAQELLRLLSRFPETVREAAARYEPSIVTRAVTELCKAYNKFYYENRILEEDAGVREACAPDPRRARHHPYRPLADRHGSPGAHVMKAVTSLKNPAVQAARALRDARERACRGAFLLDS